MDSRLLSLGELPSTWISAVDFACACTRGGCDCSVPQFNLYPSTFCLQVCGSLSVREPLSPCQFSADTVEFGILLMQSIQLSDHDMAQRANASPLIASRGPFINAIRTRWSLRVAVSGEAKHKLLVLGCLSCIVCVLTKNSERLSFNVLTSEAQNILREWIQVLLVPISTV